MFSSCLQPNDTPGNRHATAEKPGSPATGNWVPVAGERSSDGCACNRHPTQHTHACAARFFLDWYLGVCPYTVCTGADQDPGSRQDEASGIATVTGLARRPGSHHHAARNKREATPRPTLYPPACGARWLIEREKPHEPTVTQGARAANSS